jgi:hypothetical protein
LFAIFVNSCYWFCSSKSKSICTIHIRILGLQSIEDSSGRGIFLYLRMRNILKHNHYVHHSKIWLTQFWQVLLKKLIVVQLVKKFPTTKVGAPKGKIMFTTTNNRARINTVASRWGDSNHSGNLVFHTYEKF